MATWSLISSNDPPAWWDGDLATVTIETAKDTAPNEACGLYVQCGERKEVRLIPFPAVATSTSVFAHPEEVVRIVYQIRADGCDVIGTFHSHPMGPGEFSERDEMLCDWAVYHVLVHNEAGQWNTAFARRWSASNKSSG